MVVVRAARDKGPRGSGRATHGRSLRHVHMHVLLFPRGCAENGSAAGLWFGTQFRQLAGPIAGCEPCFTTGERVGEVEADPNRFDVPALPRAPHPAGSDRCTSLYV